MCQANPNNYMVALEARKGQGSQSKRVAAAEAANKASLEPSCESTPMANLCRFVASVSSEKIDETQVERNQTKSMLEFV